MAFLGEPKEFEYHAPSDIEEVSRLLAQSEEKVLVLAGGTDVCPMMKKRLLQPDVVVSLKRLPCLKSIEMLRGNVLSIGAMTTIAEVLKSELIRERYRALHLAASQMGSSEVRNLATIGGNLCRCSPASDIIPIAMCLKGIVAIYGPNGTRTEPIERFVLSGGGAGLGRGELVVAINLHFLTEQQGFCKLKRVSVDLAKVNIGVALRTERGTCREIRIAVGGVAPSVVRAKRAESALVDTEMLEDHVAAASWALMSGISPVSDVRSTAEYRRAMSAVLFRRALRMAIDDH